MERYEHFDGSTDEGRFYTVANHIKNKTDCVYRIFPDHVKAIITPTHASTTRMY